MELYLGIKLLHILSATILFGTGLGTAFFMFSAYKSNDSQAWRETAEAVVRADWYFTTPAVVVQLLSGLWLMDRVGIQFASVWFVAVIGLFALVGACWLPVVWLQIRLRDMLRAGAEPDACKQLMRLWVALGVPAFLSVIVIFGLMVYKPWIVVTL
jgi:uncharacterized membrane protein